MKPKLLRLHSQDNIVVATAPIKAQSVLKLDRVKIQIVSNVPMAGKIATRPIAEGEKIIKFGQSIGHATRNIEPGEWVHTHNLASDYLPTPEREPVVAQEIHEQEQRGDEIDSSQDDSLFTQSEPLGQSESIQQEEPAATLEVRSPDGTPASDETITEEPDLLSQCTLENPSQAEKDLTPNDEPKTQPED